MGSAWSRTFVEADLQVRLETEMSKEIYDKGLKIRKDVLGAEYVDNSFRNADEFS